MSQTDLNVANGSGAVVRADINAHLDAVTSLNSGATAPTPTFPNMWWADTSTSILKRRDNANTTWIEVMPLTTGVLNQGVHSMFIPVKAMVAATTSGAASGQVETTTNKVMIDTLDFDATADEYAQFAIRMPKSWDEGTVTAEFTWSHPATTTNFGVAWALQAVAFADNDAADTAFGTAVVTTDTGGTTDDVYISGTSGAITVAGTPAAEEWVVFRVFRDVSDAGDTMAVDARLHGVTLNITLDAGDDS